MAGDTDRAEGLLRRAAARLIYAADSCRRGDGDVRSINVVSDIVLARKDIDGADAILRPLIKRNRARYLVWRREHPRCRETVVERRGRLSHEALQRMIDDGMGK